MRISDSQQSPTHTILTKCSKMTEEKHRRHGMNGNVDGTFKEDGPKSGYAQGGRLKFFKDGKFILELERAREGERVSWVSVPRKTFWPPQGTAASTPTYRQESSTSLSVSDDNSSIQSSPWQRDHSWKQTTPRRNQSKEMSFIYWRPKSNRARKRSRKTRRPYSVGVEELKVMCCANRTKKDQNMCNNSRTGQRALLAIVQTLIDKHVAGTPPRPETVVSPRKRFLREMEKDKVQVEDGCQKRSRNKTPQIGNNNIVAASAKISGSPVRINGTTTATVAAAVVAAQTNSEEGGKAPRNCSYSITSLLAEDRSAKRSPSNSPSHFSSLTQPQYCSPSSEDRWYSESVDRLRSIELSQADKRGYPPYPPHSYLPPYLYSTFSFPPYYNPGVYGRGYVVPPMYHGPPMQMPVRHDTPSCSWAAEPTTDVESHDDNITDMPLNLSKHAG